MFAKRCFKKRDLDPAKLAREHLQNGEPVDFLYGGFEFISKVLELTENKFSKEDVFEVDAAEQYPSDFATYDAIIRFLAGENGDKLKLLIIKVRAWHGRRDYFGALIWQIYHNPIIPKRLKPKVIFVFPPSYEDDTPIEQGPFSMVGLSVKYEEGLKELELRYRSLKPFKPLYYNKFAEEFAGDYVCSEQMFKDRKLGKPLPGTFLCGEMAWLKEKGYLHPNSYL